ncbi:MAG: tRNA (adenosine(37)-N6)-threonylcarbamoyltransferase complex ATPase subunit type 1 TsaE [bacterium]|nr:tRNA (adenosine(37)-N6)-threonylcarbamoyltransferase complex ATPase subunit type 1 TsaE [bacterium]
MISKSKTQTQKLAVGLVNKILKARHLQQVRGATIVALRGELGAGKTTFVQGFMKALGVKNRITSPTFVICRKYKLKSQKSKVKSQMFFNVYHLDLYRINKPKELLDLGFKKILKDPRVIVLIEWPERAKKILPKNMILLNFKHGKNEKERIIEM